MPKDLKPSDFSRIECPHCQYRCSIPKFHSGINYLCEACGKEIPLEGQKSQKKDRIPHKSITPKPDIILPQNRNFPASSSHHNIHIDRHLRSSPLQQTAKWMGMAMLLFVAYCLYQLDAKNSFLPFIPFEWKFILIGALIAGSLFLVTWASVANRLRSFLLSFGFCIVLSGISFLKYDFSDHENLKNAKVVSTRKSQTDTILKPEETIDPIERYGLNPLLTEQEKNRASKNEKFTYAVYVKEVDAENLYFIREFLIKETQAALTSQSYVRAKVDHLIVLTEVPLKLEQVAEIARRLGQQDAIYPEHGLVSIHVDNRQFKEVPAALLGDKDHIDFYSAISSELDHIDATRIRKAVELSLTVEPKYFRHDISKKLKTLFEKEGLDFHDKIAQSLMIWAENPKDLGATAYKAMKRQLSNHEKVSDSIVSLLAYSEYQEALAELINLWLESPGTWEKHIKTYGNTAEELLLPHILSERKDVRYSALRLLYESGSEKSLPLLNEHLQHSDKETQLLVQKAIDKIKGQ